MTFIQQLFIDCGDLGSTALGLTVILTNPTNQSELEGEAIQA